MPCGVCVRIVCGDKGTCHRKFLGWRTSSTRVFFCMFVVAFPCTFVILRKNPPKTRQQCECNGIIVAPVLPGPTQDSVVRDIQSIPQHSISFTSITKIISSGKSAAHIGSLLFTTSFEKAVLTAVEADQWERGMSGPWIGVSGEEWCCLL